MKNKLEIGMYVRTRYGIAKVVKFSDTIDDRGFYLDRNIMSCNPENWEDFCTVHDIVGEPSFEIIDVIEQGDYVNGEKVEEVILDNKMSRIKTTECSTYFEEDIRSIVTKEQVAAMSYEVKK